MNGHSAALIAQGTNLLWYTSATGGPGSMIAPMPLTTTVDTTNYWVTRTLSCESPRAKISVIISPIVLVIGGNGTSLDATSGFANYQWFLSGSSVSSGTSSSYSPSQSGTYYVQVVYNGKTYTSNTVQFSLTIPLTVNVTSTPSAINPVCQGSAITVTAAATGGTGGPYTYKWNTTRWKC